MQQRARSMGHSHAGLGIPFLGQRLAWIIQKGLSAGQLRLERRDPRLQKAKPLLNDDLDRVADKTGSSPQPNELLLIRQISPFLVRHRSTIAQPRDRTPQLDPEAWDQSG